MGKRKPLSPDDLMLLDKDETYIDEQDQERWAYENSRKCLIVEADDEDEQ